jgi:hypothetical protein
MTQSILTFVKDVESEILLPLNYLCILYQFLLNDPDMVIYAELVEESMKEYIHIKQEHNLPKPAFEFFLPLPDKNKRGELINSLPHIYDPCYF